MIRLCLLAILLACTWTAPARAQLAEACASPAVRSLCKASCIAACEDPAFREGQPAFCQENGHGDAAAMAALRDDPVCATLVPAAARTDEAGEEAAASNGSPGRDDGDAGQTGESAAAEDCSRFERPSQRILCEAENRPTCSETARALEAEAASLAEEVRDELAPYEELLARDLTAVESRELLCAFSLEELDNNYLRATRDPEALRAIQRRANAIQACRGEWERYLRESAATSVLSDRVSSNVAEDLEAQFEPLKQQLRNLSRSITRLEQVAGTIEGLIRIHIDFCDPAGTPVEE
jgi:hypothetical protein